MTAKKTGRPSKLTPEIKEKILYAIRKGAPYELACNYARIDYSTLVNWRKKAEQNEQEFVQFFDDLKEAEGSIALVWLDKIDKAMDDGVWQAGAWKLERRHSKHFSSQAAVLELHERLDKLERGEKPDDKIEANDEERSQIDD